jgi:glycosyltransferase involved in cell wall biosynthesis
VVDDDLPDGDVVVATWWETAEWVAALHPSKGLKVHFVQGQEGNPLWFDPASIARASAVHRLPFARVAVSRSLVEWLETEHGCRDVALVPNAVDLELFQAPARGRQPRPTVGMLYSKDPVKGVRVSLDAWDRVRRELPDLQLVSFGVHGEVARLPLPPGTRLHVDPPQDRLRALYGQCDVWLCGSLVEGFALPPLEAMACRCPVVSTRVGGPDQIVVEGVNGHLVPVGDVAALAERLRAVLALPDARWRAMSDAALATATAYTWDDAVTRLETTLRRLLESRAAS